MLVAITGRRAAFGTNKVAQIVALGLLCTLIMGTKFSFFLSKRTVFSERATKYL